MILCFFKFRSYDDFYVPGQSSLRDSNRRFRALCFFGTGLLWTGFLPENFRNSGNEMK